MRKRHKGGLAAHVAGFKKAKRHSKRGGRRGRRAHKR